MGHEKRVPTLAQVFRIALLKGNSVQSLGSVNPSKGDCTSIREGEAPAEPLGSKLQIQTGSARPPAATISSNKPGQTSTFGGTVSTKE